ncbi:MAG: hypothetical protein HOP17_16270, partial [Acidobacteria bacterium]|nr:hypothetical protein [Acidobacteriota bacterium]
MNYSLVWEKLHNVFENPGSTTNKFIGQDTCQSLLPSPVNGSFLFGNQPADPLDDQIEARVRFIRKQRGCASLFGGADATVFDPVVLSEAILPDGSKYTFKYNEYGEITKITYPTGAYERFEYEQVDGVGAEALDIYTQTNRGVKKRFVSDDGTVGSEKQWTYGFASGTSVYALATVAPDGSSSEIIPTITGGSWWGFEDPRDGMVKEERVKDSTGALKSRTLTEWTATGPQGAGAYSEAKRDPRPVKTISIVFENGQALATMTEHQYETPGENGSTAPTDLSYFARLNVTQTKSYQYLALTPAEANEPYDTALANLTTKFHTQGVVSGISQTDYSYNADYRARGIIGLPTETRVMNPTNPTGPPLAKTQTIYDNQLPAAPGTYPGSYSVESYSVGNELNCGDAQNPKVCWQNPQSSRLGRHTTSRVWNAEGGNWIETHTRYDIFGNAIAARDPVGNEVTTEFSPGYKYAYPTKVIAPAPDPTNTTGTNLTSTVETTYDFSTGLPLTVKDDFGQITRTQYDSGLRPWRVFGENFTAPESQTIYGVPDATTGQLPPDQRFVKVRKQIDASNWDEATSWFDGLGRTVKTQARDSQGDVFVETKYDSMGRVERVTNPYRNGDTVYWSKTRYDAAGRAVEGYAPAELANLANAQSLGVTSFDISKVPGFVG